MKIAPIIAFFLVCIHVVPVNARLQGKNHQTPQPSPYSKLWIPISGPQVQVQVRQNAKNALALQQLWWRARLHGIAWFYVLALRDVTRTQPRNAVALSAYCATLFDCCLDYTSDSNYKRAKADLQGDLDLVGVRRRLEQAKKLDPNQWLIWMTESKMVPYETGVVNTLGSRAEELARRATQLSNNTYANSQLAYALICRSLWDNNKSYLHRAIIVCRRAQTLQPHDPRPSFLLLGIYRDRTHNTVEAQKVKQSILATIPLGLKLNVASRNYLKSQGIATP